jgi:hypothetical protein
MMNRLLKIPMFLLFALFIVAGLAAQNINPDNNEIFSDQFMSSIHLTLSESDKDALIYPDDPNAAIYYPAEINIENRLIDTIITPVGVRIRGNTSRGHVKKSYKIDFKEYGGEQFLKLKKLNLKPNTNDPALVREALTWMMYRKMNVPAARVGFVELYMNDEYRGVYLNVENIDDEFVDRRFGNESGNLYKCSWGATLAPDSKVYNDRIYELKTNETINDRSDLENLITAIAAVENDGDTALIERCLDVDSYLRQLAVESMTGHWDGYSFNTNNYYLYNIGGAGRFVFIPYDLDNTWGIDWIGHDWGIESIISWYSEALEVPLTKNILSVPAYFNRYLLYVEELMTWLNNDYLEPVWQYWKEMLLASVVNDGFYPLAFGYQYDDFSEAYTHAFGGHVKYGIGSYIDKRLLNTQKQLQHLGLNKTDRNRFAVYPTFSNGVELHVRGLNDAKAIKIYDLSGKSIPFHIIESQLIFSPALEPGIYLASSQQQVLRFMVRP